MRLHSGPAAACAALILLTGAFAAAEGEQSSATPAQSSGFIAEDCYCCYQGVHYVTLGWLCRQIGLTQKLAVSERAVYVYWGKEFLSRYKMADANRDVGLARAWIEGEGPHWQRLELTKPFLALYDDDPRDVALVYKQMGPFWTPVRLGDPCAFYGGQLWVPFIQTVDLIGWALDWPQMEWREYVAKLLQVNSLQGALAASACPSQGDAAKWAAPPSDQPLPLVRKAIERAWRAVNSAGYDRSARENAIAARRAAADFRRETTRIMLRPE
jgi:hypothetical protein